MRTKGILQESLRGYALPPRGEPRVSHWARVLEDGLCLAPLTGSRRVRELARRRCGEDRGAGSETAARE